MSPDVTVCHGQSPDVSQSINSLAKFLANYRHSEAEISNESACESAFDPGLLGMPRAARGHAAVCR